MPYLKSAPSNLSNCKIFWNNKNVLIWVQKCLILIYLCWNLKMLLSYLKSKASNLSTCKVSCKIEKFLNFGLKRPYLCFGLQFRKNYCYIWNQRPWMCQMTIFRAKMKMSKIGSKNALFGYFRAEMFLKIYDHIWSQHLEICQKRAFNSHSEFWYSVRYF